MASNTNFFLKIFVISLLIFSTNAQLSPNFYAGTCRNLQLIVRNAVRVAVNQETRIGASLLRLFFHDCFVNSSEMDETHDEEKPNKYDDLIRRFGLTSSNRPNIKRADLLKGAIDKFEKALLLEPDDINTKMQLVSARLSKCPHLEGKYAKKLFKEYFRLDAELKALNKVGSDENSRRITQSRTSINIRSPKEIELHHKNKYNHRGFPMEWPMRSGSSRLGIRAAAMQMRGLRTKGIMWFSPPYTATAIEATHFSKMRMQREK